MTHKPTDHLLESLSALADGEASELELHRILKSIGDDADLQSRWFRYNLIRSVICKEDFGNSLRAQPDLLAGIRGAIAGEALEGPGRDGSFRGKNTVGVAGELVSDFSEQISAAVGRQSHRPWSNWFGKSAVAASVAAAFVFGLAQMRVVSSSDQQPVLAANQTTNVDASETVVPSTLGAPLGFELPAVESRTVSVNSEPNYSPAPILARNPLLMSSNDYAEIRAQQLLNQLHILHAERVSANGGFGMMPFARLSEMDANAHQAY